MRNKGFAYDAHSKGSYEKLLDDILTLPKIPQMQDKARRYAYHFFYRRMMDFPFVSSNVNNMKESALLF